MNKKYAWQIALTDLITDPKELFSLLELNPDELQSTYRACQLFPLKVPRGFINRIEKGNAQDPLLLQILPGGAELTLLPGFATDPLQESQFNPIAGLLHKYYGRVLITLTGACAIHCRYCFRRHFPYAQNNPGRSGWDKIFAYIRNDTSISEVILSGGDPLTVPDKLLSSFCHHLETIPHVKRLRIHTRLPIVLPERITHDFIQCLSEINLELVMVIHANHAKEIDDSVRSALASLRNTHIHLLNQSVLLKRINDNTDTLIDLSETLFAAGVLPYYLHVLDKVQGAAHFDITLDQARKLHDALREKLPGYLVPRLVCEQAHQRSKTPL